jgi:hypothetical protein
MYRHAITFNTATQAIIFEAEIKGQISDGAWENSRGTCWEQWCDLTVEVGPVAGRHCHIGRTGFALHTLIDIIGERMCEYARLALAFPDCQDWRKLSSLEYRHAKWAMVDGKDSFSEKLRATVAEFGGVAEIDARLDAVKFSYDIGELKKDLTAIKAAMKAEVR